eukprot:2736802-Rhodomonas_salina.1
MDVDVDPEREGTGGVASPAPVTEYWVGQVGFSTDLGAGSVCVFCEDSERGRGALVEPAPPAAPAEF